MTPDVKVFVREEEIDISDAEKLGLALSYSIAEISKVDRRSSGSSGLSKTMTIPGTKNNIQRLGLGQDVNITDDYTQNIRGSGRIEINGIDVIRGVAKMLSPIDRRGLNAKEYKLVILGDNSDWRTAIKDLTLRDIDFSDQDHVYSVANVDQSETVAPGRHYVYPLINYGKFVERVKFDINIISFSGTGNIYSIFFDGPVDIGWFTIGGFIELDGMFFPENNAILKITAKNNVLDTILVEHPAGNGFVSDETNTSGFGTVKRLGQVTILDRYPSINVAEALKRIFSNIRYKIESEFIDGDFFKRLYIPFTLPILRQSAETSEASLYNVGFSGDLNGFTSILPFDTESGGEFFDNGSNYDNTLFEYTVPQTGKMRFIAELNMTSIFGGQISLQRNGVSQFFGSSTQIGIVAGMATFDTGEITVTAGEKWRVGAFGITPLLITAANTRFYNVVSEDIGEGATVDLSANLPEVQQVAWVGGLRDMFNLRISADPFSKKVFIEPRDDFHNGEPVNWTDKLDHDQNIVNTFPSEKLAKTIRYRYTKDGNDKPVDEIELELDKPFGSFEHRIANEFAKDDIRDKAVIFAPTYMNIANHIGFITSKIPQLYNQPSGVPEKSTDFNIRLLYYDGVKNMDAGESWIWENTVRTDYPYMYSYNDDEINDNSLMFDERPRSNGLVQKHYRNEHKTIDESKLSAAFFWLDEADISNLDFRSPVLLEIDGEFAEYILNKVSNYAPARRKSTLVQLLKVVDSKAIAPVELGEGNDKIVIVEKFPQPPNIPTEIDQDNNIIMKIGGTNRAETIDSLALGDGLITDTPHQTVVGRHNIRVPGAKFILATGNGRVKENGLVLKEDGSLAVGGGGYVTAVIGGAEIDIRYLDSNGEAQFVTKN